MRGFHDKVFAHIRKHQLFSSGDKVLVACSGGIDSMVLLHFLKTYEDKLGITVFSVHVNHMLREQESLEDRYFTERMSKEWNTFCYSADIPVNDVLKKEGGNKQDVCRRLRYAFFNEVSAKIGATKIVTAHHADDQLETFLMSGIRGTLLSGIPGIPVKRPFGTAELVRPLLTVSKKEINEYAASLAIPYREDPSNNSPVYTRNRLRSRVLPVLQEETPHAAVQISSLTESLQEDQQFLMELAKTSLDKLISRENEEILLSAESFRAMVPALQKRMVPLLLNYLYPEEQQTVTAQLIEQVQELLQHSSGTVFLHLPQGNMMTRQYDQVIFSKQPPEQHSIEKGMPVTAEWSESIHGFRFKAVPKEEASDIDGAELWYFSSAGKLPLLLRSRKAGDRIELPGMRSAKKVSRVMIDEKLPLLQRDTWPIIAAETGEIMLIPGVRQSKFVSSVAGAEGDWVLIEQRITPPGADF